MKQKVTFEMALRDINRKTKKTSDGKVLSNPPAEITAKSLIEEERQILLNYIPKLEWTDLYVARDLPGIIMEVSSAATPFGTYVITKERQVKTYQLVLHDCLLTEDGETLDKVKHIAEEDYKKRILEIFGL
jgi:hypothetical protein|nr:MAG TPA: hypothetical protein [Caudoviricetes sp.]